MFPASRFAAYVALTLSVAGCARFPAPSTTTAPESQPTLRRFRISSFDASSPNTSVRLTTTASRSIAAQISRGLIHNGYVLDTLRPDFEVMFYATAGQDVDIAKWNGGNPLTPDQSTVAADRGVGATLTRVVIDIVDPHSHTILWTGTGRVALASGVTDNALTFSKVADAIIAGFPTSGNLMLENVRQNAVVGDKY
jgi:hypothetical protein